MFGVIAPDAQDLLMRFQTNLAAVIKPIGDIQFSEYRSFRNAEREGDGPYRFIDGEFIEKFLDMDEQAQQTVCEGLGPNVEAMRNMVEELRRMH